MTKAQEVFQTVYLSKPSTVHPTQVESQFHSESFLILAKSKIRKICLFVPNFKNCDHPVFSSKFEDFEFVVKVLGGRWIKYFAACQKYQSLLHLTSTSHDAALVRRNKTSQDCTSSQPKSR